MHFTDRQKDIIRKIESDEIYDIFSFISTFQLCKLVQYDYNKVRMAFQQDTEAETCYYPKNLTPTLANRISKQIFLKKQGKGEIIAENYVMLKPELQYTCAKQEELCMDEHFTFNFYTGVEILTDFEALVDFLSIWQFLKEESMVLDTAQPLDVKTVGLFFELNNHAVPAPEASEETGTLQFSDRKYLGSYHHPGQNYHLSAVHLQICRDFLGRRMYPAPKLKLFLQNKFRTKDEIQQFHALVAAWMAIAVSIVIAAAQSWPVAWTQYLQNLFH